MGLTCYFKWPYLKRFLVENENPGETSGFLFYHNELAQSFGEQVEQLVRDHPSVKGDLGKCILKKKIVYLLKCLIQKNDCFSRLWYGKSVSN